MRDRAYKAMVYAECEQALLKLIRLKVRNPMWHDVDRWLEDLAASLKFIKIWR